MKDWPFGLDFEHDFEYGVSFSPVDEPIVIPKHRLNASELAAIVAEARPMLPVMAGLLGGLALIIVGHFVGLPPTAAIPLGLIAAPFYGLLYRFVTLKRPYAKPQNSVFLGTCEITLDQNGIRRVMENGIDSYVPWRAVTNVIDGKRAFRIGFAANQYFFIPRHILGSELDAKLLLFFAAKGLIRPKNS